MQSHQSAFGKENSGTLRGHRRRQSLGKAMPVTSLLLNFPPLNRSAYYTRDERSPDHELPPLYFPVNDDSSRQMTPPASPVLGVRQREPAPLPSKPSTATLTPKPIATESTKLKKKSRADINDHLDGSDNDTTEHDFEILISECSSNSSNSSDENDDDDNMNVTLIGNSTFYTPCLTCTNSAPVELANRPSAINEMCRRLCSDECRLRLSLAGFEPPSEAALKSRMALSEHVRNSLVSDSKKSMPLDPPALPMTRPPPPIAIQRKKFLMELLTPTDSDSDSNFVDDSENAGEAEARKTELLQVVEAVVDHPDDVSKGRVAHIVDPHEISLLKDFREQFEIAEALAKTSAMTSTAQIKQRLAARKLEMELESISNKPFDRSGSGSRSRSASFIASVEPNADGCGITTLATPTRNEYAADVQTSATQPDTLAKYDGNDFEPPRDLLLYLVRMGSFNSAPKINNVDSQDDSLEIPQGLSTNELLHHVRLLRGEHYPSLLSRYFLKPIELQSPSLATQLASNDITDGLRYLQLSTVSRGCSAPLSSAPNQIRLLQWNILSQSLGQNNDGFVCCPDEALTWENRKYLIVQEILQHNPDIVCLQEVDHFKFLQTILGSQNYEGIFFPKPDSPCLYIEDNNGPDGCAIFFKRDKFELRKCETRILEVWRVQSNQVAIALNLNVKAINKEICVCTTHLKARQGSLLSKLRNEQGRDLIRFIRNFAGESRPVILCGDFNAEPMEPVYATMLSCEKLKFSSAYADIRSQNGESDSQEDKVEKAVPDVSEDNTDSKAIECEDYLQKSVQNEPPYTTWKIREDGEECHTIDYVFYAKDHFKVLNCLEFPLENEIGKNRTPSFQYPSDHFSLVCDFEILENISQRKDQESNMQAQ